MRWSSIVGKRAGRNTTAHWLGCGLALVFTFLTPMTGPAAGVEYGHVTVPTPGGMPAVPFITGLQVSSNKATLSWQNASGPYRVWRKKSLADPTWQLAAGPLLSNSISINTTFSNAFFRVSGPTPQFLGSQACQECHAGIHASEMDTRHAQALQTLKNIGQGANKACLPCHTVGYGLPSGFINETSTPHLAGVQCESCHGPAALHAANENDPLLRPRVELAGQLCGGCHTGARQPTYDEWVSTGHAVVTEDMNPAGRINSCGRCHSGPARMALLKGQDPAVAVAGDANIGVTCVTCHNPHENTANEFQLRNPVASTNDFFLSTSEAFTNKYNPNVNVCAQCHNHRGADWTSGSRPPHRSPQYNVLLGTVGEVTNGVVHRSSTHAREIEKQCVGCHMPKEEFVSEASPAMTGHTFKVESFDSCLDCHPEPELLVEFSATVFSSRIQRLKGWLDLWATTKAPSALRTKYGARAWEYTNPGDLSSGGTGPTSSEQSQIPNNIKRARFNLYIVKNDGSYGVHNPLYSLDLLNLADAWVLEELNK